MFDLNFIWEFDAIIAFVQNRKLQLRRVKKYPTEKSSGVRKARLPLDDLRRAGIERTMGPLSPHVFRTVVGGGRGRREEVWERGAGAWGGGGREWRVAGPNLCWICQLSSFINFIVLLFA